MGKKKKYEGMNNAENEMVTNRTKGEKIELRRKGNKSRFWWWQGSRKSKNNEREGGREVGKIRLFVRRWRKETGRGGGGKLRGLVVNLRTGSANS